MKEERGGRFVMERCGAGLCFAGVSGTRMMEVFEVSSVARLVG